jgi:RHS repeat-associated protein
VDCFKLYREKNFASVKGALGLCVGSKNNWTDDYRFGFNGMEKDNEVKGTGNSLDFGARIYDSMLGRWLSLDPLQEKYPMLSPYNFVGNNPIANIDPDGRVIIVLLSAKQGHHLTYTPGIEPPKGSPQIILDVHKACMEAMQTPTGKRIWENVHTSTYTTAIMASEVPAYDVNAKALQVNELDVTDANPWDMLNSGNIGIIRWDSKTLIEVATKTIDPNGATDMTNAGLISPSTVLLHKLGHASDCIDAIKDDRLEEFKTENSGGSDIQYGTIAERKNITNNETPYINELNALKVKRDGNNASYEQTRQSHGSESPMLPERFKKKFPQTKVDVNNCPTRTQQKAVYDKPTSNGSN